MKNLTQTVVIDDEGRLQDVLAANSIGAQSVHDDLQRMIDAGTAITVLVPGMPARAIVRKKGYRTPYRPDARWPGARCSSIRLSFLRKNMTQDLTALVKRLVELHSRLEAQQYKGLDLRRACELEDRIGSGQMLVGDVELAEALLARHMR